MDGNDVGQFLYSPFGEMWVEEASTVDISHITRFFTNQQYDKESGLYYYNARFYDPHLGSFLTPDPKMDQLNHYAYCAGNPIKYTDPTGLSLDYSNAGSAPVDYDNSGDYAASYPDYSNPSSAPTYSPLNDTSPVTPPLDTLQSESQLSYPKEQQKLKEEKIKEQLKPDKELKSSRYIGRYGNQEGRKISYGTRDVIKTLREAAKRYYEATGQMLPGYGKAGHMLWMGDLSKKGGGPIFGANGNQLHTTHQKGLSIDILPGTKDGKRIGNYNEDPNYSLTNTIKMISIINEVAAENNLELQYVIFADPDVYKSDQLSDIYFITEADNNGAELLNDHYDHIHFEFKAIYIK
jgi:RHS repeat-associated protein